MWRHDERIRWMVCLGFGGVALYASRAVFPISSVALAQEMHWDKQEIGLVLGIFFWGYAMTQILAGYISDVIGGELIIATSSIVWSFITISFIWLPRISSDHSSVFNLFLCGRFFLGVSQGFYYPSLASMMAKHVQLYQRNLTFAVLNAGSHLGTLLCGSIGSYLLTQTGWRTPVALIGMFSLVWSLYVYLVMVASRTIPPLAECTSRRKSMTNDVVLIVIPSSELDVSKHTKKDPDDSNLQRACVVQEEVRPLNWPRLFQHSSFWVILLANFVHNNSFYIILNWCPSYFHDNFPDARSWVFNMVPWLIILPSVIVSGWLADGWIRRGIHVTTVRKRITTVVLFGSSCFLLLLTWVDNYYASLAFMAMALACLGFHSSGVLLNPQDIAPYHSGQVYGIMATVGTIPGFVGVYLAGYILEKTQEWSMVFFLTSLVSIFGWLAYLRYGSSTPLV